MIILCWITSRGGILVDHFTTFETLEDGQLAYDLISKNENVYSASLCKPIASTEAHYLD